MAIVVGYLLHAGYQFRTMTIERHDVGLMGRQLVVDENLATTRLIEYRDRCTIAECRFALHQQDVHILNEAVMADIVVSDVVTDILDAAIITYRDVVQRNVAQSGVLLDATRQGKRRFEATELHVA